MLGGHVALAEDILLDDPAPENLRFKFSDILPSELGTNKTVKA